MTGAGPTPDTSGRVLTLPNLISFLRLLAVPWFCWLILARRDFVTGGFVFLAIGGTDWVDGYLARRLDQVSEVGKFLDPLADRLMIAAAVICGLVAGALPLVIGIPLAVRELLVGVGAWYLVSRGGGKLAVRRRGKLATFLLFGALAAFYVAAGGLASTVFLVMAWPSAIAGLVLYYWVGFEYAGDIRRRLGTTAAAADG